jgi:hypothetical protein
MSRLATRIGFALLAAALSAAAAPAARADSLVSLPEPDYAADAKNPQQQALPEYIRHLVYPTIGLPAILAPGEELTPLVRLPDNGTTADWSARLESARDLFVQTVRLRFKRAAFDASTSTYRLAFEVPPGTPQDVYDLVVESASLPSATRSDVQPNAVRVWRDSLDYDFAHVADTQIRDPTTRLPQKWEQLLAELKLRDPVFTLYSGDLNFGTDYPREYAENHEIMRQGGVPLVCAPGNHDGYGWLLDASTALYDGLHLWRRTIGPTYMSVRFGRQRFIAANSFGGPLARRNSYTFLTVNAGGDLEPEQLAWLESEARSASDAGEEAVVFLHHNPHPSKSFIANVPAFPWATANIGAGNATWNGAAARRELTRIFSAHAGVRWVMAGHTNYDEHLVESLGAGAAAHEVHYVNTTSPCNGGSPREGYRIVRVRGGRIAEIDYDPAQPSVPFPLGGNLATTFLDPNDGTQGRVRVRVSNLLEKPVEATLELYVRADPRGYVARGGWIREVGQSDVGPFVVYLRTTVPAQGSIETSVEPAAAGGGARPAALGGGVSSGPAVAGGAGGGSGGGGCASGGPGGAAAPTWLLALLGILSLRARRD